MRLNYITLTILSLAANIAVAQTDGKKNIEKLCGCYDVKFTYAETFAPDSNYNSMTGKHLMHAN